MRKSGWAFLAIALCGVPLYGRGPMASPRTRPSAAPTVEAVSVTPGTAAILVDGDLNEPVWTSAQPVGEFLQREPNEGAPPTHPTEVRVAYDDKAIYVGVSANEPEGDRIRALLTRRDDSSPSDWIRVLIDSYHDRRTAFEFAVNAAGVKQDSYWYNDSNNDVGWDAVWDVGIGRSPEGWRAEFRIPFSQLRFNPASAGTFGFAVVRTVAHINETSTWPLLAKSASGYVSSFGDLTGLALTGGQKKLELLPYAVAQVATAPVAAGNPLARSPDPGVSAGLDLKYQVGAGLTLTGTINPDFGQVEADPAVVNLAGFETFFSERRPFFVEGSGNFSFDLDCNDGNCTGLFYSRRIGRTPHRSVGAPDQGFVAQPANTTILGAAKLTGRVGKFSIGALNAVTGSEEARLAAGPALTRSTSPVEPATNYSILRVNREFTNHSRFGFMVTSTNRSLPDELNTLPGSAVTGGVDGDWRLHRGGYSLSGHWAGSLVRGTAGAIADLQQDYVHAFARPDAGHVTFDPHRTQLAGDTGGLGFSKITGRKVHFSSNLSYKSPGFETNDLGYLQRADDISTGNWLQWIHDVPTRHVRSVRVNFNEWASWNFDHDLRYSGGNINAHWVLANNWGFGSGFNVNSQGFDDRLTRGGGPGGYVPGNISHWGYLNSDDRKVASASTFFNWGRIRDGSWFWGISPGISIRPTPAIEARVGIDFNRNLTESQWVENLVSDPVKHYVFGRLDQTTIGISLRLNYTLAPRLSLQLYGQPFVSTGAYTNFRELVDGRAPRNEDRYAPFAYGGHPDFSYLSFRTTNVLRWEYRPGSTLFVVWQQGREDNRTQGAFEFGRDIGRTFSARGTNTVLIKFSRWLNF